MRNSFEGGNQESEKKYGLNIHAVFEFGRHDVPGKIKEGPKKGMSADFLTDEGKQNSADRGYMISEENVVAYGSPKKRAQETVDIEMQAAEIFSEGGVNVVNKKLEDMPEGLLKEGVQKEGNKFKVKIAEELDATADFDKIMPKAKEWAQEQIDAGSEKGLYHLIVQYYLDNSELCEQEGVDTPREAASQIAYRAAREVGMTRFLKNDTDIRMVNISHGPKLEPFLLEVVDDFKTLDDLGEALSPGESFSIEVNTDDSGNREIKLKFRDKEYNVNEEALEALATEYRDKVKAEREQ